MINSARLALCRSSRHAGLSRALPWSLPPCPSRMKLVHLCTPQHSIAHLLSPSIVAKSRLDALLPPGTGSPGSIQSAGALPQSGFVQLVLSAVLTLPRSMNRIS